MKIGVGICTYKRPEYLAECVAACEKYNRPHFDLHIQEDEPRVGIAKNKNRILARFTDYDYIIILEDDSRPIHENWITDHISAYQHSNIHHFSYIWPGDKGVVYKTINLPNGHVIQHHQHVYAQFQFFTWRVLEVCGGFDKRFDIYGSEHMEFSTRISGAGLCPPQPGYTTLEHVADLVAGERAEHSISKEERKAQILKNQDIWKQIAGEKELYREYR